MSWSQVEPLLPEGSAWEQHQEKIDFHVSNWYILSAAYDIARLEGTQFAVRVTVTTRQGHSGFHPDYDTKYLRCDIGGVEGTPLNTGSFAQGKSYWYFVGEAAPGMQITAVCGSANSSSSKTKGTVFFEAPAHLIHPVVWQKQNGIWVKVLTL